MQVTATEDEIQKYRQTDETDFTYRPVIVPSQYDPVIMSLKGIRIIFEVYFTYPGSRKCNDYILMCRKFKHSH